MEENPNMEDNEHPLVPVQGWEHMQRHLSAKFHHLHVHLILCIWDLVQNLSKSALYV